MAANPFISARIPSEILEQLEHYSEVTGDSKSKVVVKALASFLENPNKSEYEISITSSEKRIRTLENYMNERFRNLEAQLEKLDKKMFYASKSSGSQT